MTCTLGPHVRALLALCGLRPEQIDAVAAAHELEATLLAPAPRRPSPAALLRRGLRRQLRALDTRRR